MVVRTVHGGAHRRVPALAGRGAARQRQQQEDYVEVDRQLLDKEEAASGADAWNVGGKLSLGRN